MGACKFRILGNGGLLRLADDPMEREFAIKPDEREHVRSAFKAIGITPSGDDDEVFVVGRAAYARGARATDMPVKNNYA